MNNKKSVTKNFMYNMSYQILGLIIPLVTTPYLSRVLLPEGIGQYAYAYSVANYFVLFTMLGVNNYGNRTIAKSRDSKENISRNFWGIFYVQLICSLLCILVYVIYLLIYKKSDIVFWIMILYVISAGFDINWFFYGMEEFRITVTRNVIVKLITTVCIFLFVKKSSDVWSYTLIMVGGILGSQIILWPFIKRYVYRVRLSFDDIKKHFLPNICLFLPTIAVSIYKIMDKLMIGIMSGNVEVGFYESIDKIINIPLCAVVALGTVMLPRITNSIGKENDRNIERITHRSVILSLVLTAPIVFGTMAVASKFVPLFYGPGYEKCISLLYIMMPSTLFVAVANVIRTQILIPYSRDRAYIVSCCMGAVLNLFLNILLIHAFQSVGAAIATLCTEGVVCIIQAISARDKINIRRIFKDAIPILLSAWIMAVLVILIPNIFVVGFVDLAFRICLGAVIYLIIIYVYIKKKKLFL